MNKLKQLAIVYPVLVMFVICLVITAALAGTNSITRKKITEINEQNEKAAMQRLIEADEYEKNKVVFEDRTYEYRTAKKNGEVCGYLFKISGKGYGGNVTVMIALNVDGSVANIEVLDASNETPGLGQNTARPEFTDQFRGKSKRLEVIKSGNTPNEDQVDAVASATVTSRAVTSAVNTAIELFGEIDYQNTADPASAAEAGEGSN